MNLISIQCPHCGRELNVPEDVGSIVCMYCAKPINARELLNDWKRPIWENESLTLTMEQSIPNELLTMRLDLTHFNASQYPAIYEDYLEQLRPVLNAFQQAVQVDENAAPEQFAQLLFERCKSALAKKKASEIFESRFTITSLLIPAILSLNNSAAERAVDFFLDQWNQAYPKEKLGKATYEQIQSGFKRRLCYITTAVCCSLGAGDDCTELNELRAFRDGWLISSKDGNAKIAEYYLFAPMIVQAIDRSAEGAKEYRNIWDAYLLPCLNDLRAGRRRECADGYEKMVRTLERKWLS